MRGLFVTFEGIDRSGKTTQAGLLVDALGDEALGVREPGGTPAGEKVRELLKDPSVMLSPEAEALLFAGSLVNRGLMVGDLHFPSSVEVALQWGECSAVENPEHGARNRDRGCNQCRDELRIHRIPKV